MENIKRRRLDLKFTIAQLTQRTGIPKSTLWNIEQGRCLPDPVAAKALRQVLVLPGIPDSSQVLQPKFALRRPFDRPRVNQVYWQRMESAYGYQLRQLKPPPLIVEWMKECLASDSPVECVALCTLAADGAVGQFSSPHDWGFRQLCILDRDGLALGGRFLPGLQWNVEGKRVLIWPQVNVLTPKGTFRLDMLVLLDDLWLVVEIDGKTHTLEYNNYRDECLALTTLRLSNEDVCKLRFARLLRQQLALQKAA